MDRVTVDQDNIRSLTRELSFAVLSLRRLAAVDRQVFLTDDDQGGNAKYNFIVAIDVSVQLAADAITAFALRRPTDHADTFRILGEAGVFADDLRENLVAMALFRDALVRSSRRTDDRTIYRILSDRLGDFRQFVDHLKLFIDY